MKLKQTHYEIIKFVIVGGINTLDYYLVYLILLKLLHIHYMVSHIIGFIVSFVYRVKPTLKKFLSFPLTQVVNMGMQSLFLYIFVRWFNFPSEIAPFVGLIVTIPITFILSKWILKD